MARPPTKRGGGVLSALGRLLLLLILLLVIVPPLWVVAYRVIPPPITVLMIQRSLEGRGIDRRWVPLSRISPAMVRAAIASEDARFCAHHGFDVQAIQAAMAHNQRRPGRIRGGSTISQQTAKNVFLWPQRSWLRKGAEAWFTVLIETLWGKRRIMEVYLNTIETGPGVYGVEAAARRYFGQSAAELDAARAARIAAVIPSSLEWKAVHPGRYVRRRTGRIDARERTVSRGGLAGCVLGG